MVFTGTYEHSIDAKNRLAIPADVRDQVRHEAGRKKGGVYLYVTLGESGALCLYTADRWEQRSSELDASELDPDELLAYEQLLYSQTHRVELDKQGRIRLPEMLLERSKLGSDVVLIGVKDHLEVRDRKTWQEFVNRTLAEQPRMLMNPRRAMRKAGREQGR